MSLSAKVQLQPPSLEELSAVFQTCLASNFKTISCSVSECPDLTKFGLTCSGIGGSPRIADVGGERNLIPLPQADKTYDLRNIAELCELPDGFLIGPGAGPLHHGVCEMMANCQPQSSIGTQLCKVDSSSPRGYQLYPYTKTDFALMGNFFISQGKPGKVIHIRASHRTGEDNFISCLRKGLKHAYGDRLVSIGGCFILEKGQARMHVMPPAFSKTPLNSMAEVENWLQFFDMGAPMTCLTVFHSHDPGYALRMEHTHCFSDHGDGGHYHDDITPAAVIYSAYLLPADWLFKID